MLVSAIRNWPSDLVVSNWVGSVSYDGRRGEGREGWMHGIFAFEAYGFDNGFCYLFDAYFFVFANCGLEVLDG